MLYHIAINVTDLERYLELNAEVLNNRSASDSILVEAIENSHLSYAGFFLRNSTNSTITIRIASTIMILSVMFAGLSGMHIATAEHSVASNQCWPEQEPKATSSEHEFSASTQQPLPSAGLHSACPASSLSIQTSESVKEFVSTHNEPSTAQLATPSPHPTQVGLPLTVLQHPRLTLSCE